MTNIIDNMLSLCPVSEDTIQELKNVWFYVVFLRNIS